MRLINVPTVKDNCSPLDYYKNVKEDLKDNPTHIHSIYWSDVCISPMTITQLHISSKWDKKVFDWISWVNENICMTVDDQNLKTTEVKLRIATGMLNNIKSLTDLEKMQIHSNLTSNVKSEFFAIQESLLPF